MPRLSQRFTQLTNPGMIDNYLSRMTLICIAMIGRPKPVLRMLGQAMLHGIEPAVLDQAIVLGPVSNDMLPVPSLPDTSFPRTDVRSAALPGQSKFARESTLDLVPDQREIRVVGVQFHHGVEMIWQNHDCRKLKAMLGLSASKCVSQEIDSFDQMPCASIRQSDRKEIGPAGNKSTSVERHSATL
jgi:hypothetical protein